MDPIVRDFSAVDMLSFPSHGAFHLLRPSREAQVVALELALENPALHAKE
jgi:hypothetical protein